MNVNETLRGLPKAATVIIVFAGLAVVSFLDYNTGVEISFSIFYLLPISFAAWFLGKWEGIFAALLSSILWFIGDERGHAYSNETIPYWNALVRMGFFSIVVVLLNYIKKFNISLGAIISEKTVDLTREITERKKAEEEVNIKNLQLSQLAMNIQKVKEEENLNMAREIHDELGQVLSALKIEISWLNSKFSDDAKGREKMKSINTLIDDTLKSVRRISTHLRPRLLDDLGLFPAIEMQVREFQTRTGTRCLLSLPEEGASIDVVKSLAIFRIFQEAMTNISRHANATHVEIKSYVEDEKLIMEIKDNGIGIYNNFPVDDNSLGILGMKERANLLNGEVVIKGIPSGGTFVKVNIPL